MSSSSSTETSSSSIIETTPQLPLINQNNYNLLPFTYIGESGNSIDLGDASKLTFTIESSNAAYFKTGNVLDRSNIVLTQANTVTNSVYVPQDDASKYQHESSFYVDVISNNAVSQVRTHTEPNAYEFEDPENVFIIPKFTWTFDNSYTNVTTTTIGYNGRFWASTSNGNLDRIRYNTQTSIADFSNVYSSSVNRVVFAPDNDKMYVSTNDYLYIYSIDDYLSGSERQLVLTSPNYDRYNISLHDGTSLWTLDPYKGNVLKMDVDTLVTTKIYAGFDAPFKIVKSEFHNCYIVAGTHMLWKINDSTSESEVIYEVDDYNISDFDVSKDGKVCLLLHSINEEKDVARILNYDFYTFLIDERISGYVKFCKYFEYENKGKFYILVEINSSGTVYQVYHYIYDITTKVLSKIDSSHDLQLTTTTTTATAISQAIKIEKPISGEQIEAGKEYEITWSSSKSISDFVKIELYKGGYLSYEIEAKVENSGIYRWIVPTELINDDNYQIKITWLAANNDAANSDISSNFEVASVLTVTTTTTTFAYSLGAVAIDYNSLDNQIVIMLSTGLFSIFDINSGNTYGLIESGLSNVVWMVIKNVEAVANRVKQTKVRVFVGSSEYLSDKWDSGEIETSLTSMYYGGGNNLVGGQKYYVNIQAYADDLGWSDLQTITFIMPK